MKKILSLIAAILSIASVSFAAEIEDGGPLRKLQRGFVNIALSPMELTNELAKEKKENSDQLPPSWIAGTARGSFFVIGRALAGVYDIATFPLSLPKDYGPLIQPEFPWQHLPKGN